MKVKILISTILMLISSTMVISCKTQQGPSLAEKIKTAEGKKTTLEQQLNEYYRNFEIVNKQYQAMVNERATVEVKVSKAEKEYQEAQNKPLGTPGSAQQSSNANDDGIETIYVDPFAVTQSSDDHSGALELYQLQMKELEEERAKFIRSYENRYKDAKKVLDDWDIKNGPQFKLAEQQVNDFRSKISGTNAELSNVQKELAYLYSYQKAGYK